MKVTHWIFLFVKEMILTQLRKFVTHAASTWEKEKCEISDMQHVNWPTESHVTNYKWRTSGTAWYVIMKAITFVFVEDILRLYSLHMLKNEQPLL